MKLNDEQKWYFNIGLGLTLPFALLLIILFTFETTRSLVFPLLLVYGVMWFMTIIQIWREGFNDETINIDKKTRGNKNGKRTE